jgi:hypothetical protein
MEDSIQRGITREEVPCTEDDIYLLRQKYAQQKKYFRIFWYIIIFIALVFPFVPSKYKPHNAMVDIMSYPMAIISIIGVFLIVMVWNYYFLIYRLKMDITEARKIVLTSYVAKRKESKYRGNVHYYITVAGVPYSLARHIVSFAEYRMYQPGTEVMVEYSKRSKQLMRIIKI